MSKSSKNTQPDVNSLDLNVAMDWIRNWRDSYLVTKQGLGMPLDIKGFLISKSDFAEVMSNSDCEHVRLYLAAGPSEEGANLEVPKLIVVGVDSDGKDIIGTSSTDSYVYDFSHPCPRECDTNSPLFTLPSTV